MMTISLAQLVESLTLSSILLVRDPSLSLFFFMQIIFLNLSYLLLMYISDIFFFHANYLFKSILPTIDVHFGSF